MRADLCVLALVAVLAASATAEPALTWWQDEKTLSLQVEGCSTAGDAKVEVVFEGDKATFACSGGTGFELQLREDIVPKKSSCTKQVGGAAGPTSGDWLRGCGTSDTPLAQWKLPAQCHVRAARGRSAACRRGDCAGPAVAVLPSFAPTADLCVL